MSEKVAAKKTTELSPELRAKRDHDRKKVRGKFIFHEVPNGRMEFVYRAYKGDPIEKYDMVDGEVYTVPLGIAKHLNTNCWYPAYDYRDDEQGRPKMKMAQRIRRCSFQSLEFVDHEGVKAAGSSTSAIENITE